MMRFPAVLAALLVLFLTAAAQYLPPEVPTPLGLIPIVWPASNPYSSSKADLGRLLYFDPRLSATNTVSCATCHAPGKGFADGTAFSAGVKGQKGTRSAPTIVNRAYSLAQFWDGRAASLEAQVIEPITNPIEMGETHANVVAKLGKVEGYRTYFQEAYGSPQVTIDRIAMAIATYERTLLSGNSAYDRYRNGDEKAMSPAQVRGMDVFINKAKCDQCHEGVNFTSNSYHNIGIGTDAPDPDTGRFVVTKHADDWAAFKTPTLRDIAKTAPYMHDGSLKTLEEVVDYYDKGGTPNKNLDPKIVKLHLSEQDKQDLVEFLKALDGTSLHVMAPALPQ